jgi:hypothetical protein
MFGSRLSGITIALMATSSIPISAAEQTLQCKLVVQQVGVPSQLPEIGGHKVSVGEYMGVATFEDGRIAHKRFVDVSDDTAEGGSFKGYSTYTFESGDAITLSYTGGWDSNGMHGDYTVISGTGEFKGATGTGSFKGLDEPWDDASMLDVSLNLSIPSQ